MPDSSIISFDMAQGPRSCFFVFAVAISVTLVGCAAAYNARTVDSPNWKYAANVYIRGALGRSYVRETEKLVRVSIYALKPDAKESSAREMREAAASGTWRSKPNDSVTDTLLFEKQYWVKGSAIEWEPVWGSQGDLSITLYDDGPGVSSERKDAPKRILKTMNYHFDTHNGVYREGSAQVR